MKISSAPDDKITKIRLLSLSKYVIIDTYYITLRTESEFLLAMPRLSGQFF